MRDYCGHANPNKCRRRGAFVSPERRDDLLEKPGTRARVLSLPGTVRTGGNARPHTPCIFVKVAG